MRRPGPTDLAPDRRDDRRVRHRRRNRRHDQRHRPLPERAEPERDGRGGRPRGVPSTPATSPGRIWSRGSASNSGRVTFDPSVVDRYVKVSDKDSFRVARAITRQEGILVGGSAGTAVFAALRVARELDESKTIVVLLPDTGRKYLSKLYSDSWMLHTGCSTSRAGARRGGAHGKAHGAPADHHGRRARQGASGDDRAEAATSRRRRSSAKTAPTCRSSSDRSATASCSTGSSAIPMCSRPTSPK